MFTKYAITVIETVSTRDGSRSRTADKVYFEKINIHDYLHLNSAVTTTFDSQEAAENLIEELPVSRCGSNYNSEYEYGVEAIEYTHANHSGWSDVHPYEIVRVVSPKTIEIRVMDAELDENWKPEIIAGGFAGHCTNQGAQKWDYKSNPDYTVIRARLRKDGYFHSANGRHVLSKTPYKFHDYNF
jgi:hypothetical protein